MELKDKHKDDKLNMFLALVFLLMVIAFTKVGKLSNNTTENIDKSIQE